VQATTAPVGTVEGYAAIVTQGATAGQLLRSPGSGVFAHAARGLQPGALSAPGRVAAMPSTAGTACHRSDAGGAQSSVQRFREDSTAWASATPWRPPADAAVTLSLAGVSSLLRCPQPRPAQFHVLPGCLRPAEARAIHDDASATHDRQQAQRAFVLRKRAAEKPVPRPSP